MAQGELVSVRWLGSSTESDDIVCGKVDLFPTGVLKLRLPTTFSCCSSSTSSSLVMFSSAEDVRVSRAVIFSRLVSAEITFTASLAAVSTPT